MRRALTLTVIILGTATFAQAQIPQGEFRACFQSIQGFDDDSGSPDFAVLDEPFNGGGFGFTFNLLDWLGFYSETDFLTGVGTRDGWDPASGTESGSRLLLLSRLGRRKESLPGSGEAKLQPTPVLFRLAPRRDLTGPRDSSTSDTLPESAEPE